MRIARPFALELEYTRAMMLALLLRPSPRWPKSVLLIGLGAASLPKFLYRNRPKAALTVVEIDAAVVTTAAQYFELPDDRRRLAIEIADGHEYVAATDRRFDLIIVDGYDAKCRVGMLETLPFYTGARACLTETGILVTNFLNRHRGLRASLERMDRAFDSRVCALPACASGNIIAAAATGAPVDISLADLRTGALALKHDTGLNLAPMVARLAKLQAGLSDRFAL
jgi:spermidine synthase